MTSVTACSQAATIVGQDGITRYVVGTAADLKMRPRNVTGTG